MSKYITPQEAHKLFGFHPMAIMHCFSSKLCFLRRYKEEIKKEVEKTEKQG